jgi:hypothetical protein
MRARDTRGIVSLYLLRPTRVHRGPAATIRCKFSTVPGIDSEWNSSVKSSISQMREYLALA